IHVRNALRYRIESFERAHKCVGREHLNLDTTLGHFLNRLRQPTRGGKQARHGVRPVGHHLQLSDSLCDCGRWETEGRAGGRHYPPPSQSAPPSHACRLSIEPTSHFTLPNDIYSYCATIYASRSIWMVVRVDCAVRALKRGIQSSTSLNDESAVHRSEIFALMSAQGQTRTINIRVLCLLPPAADITLKSARAAVCQILLQKSFPLVTKTSPGCRRDFRVNMWGTSSPDDKLVTDLAKATEAIKIAARRSDRLMAGKLSPLNFGLLQQNL